MGTAAFELELDVLIEDERWAALGLDALAQRAVEATLLRVLGRGKAEVSLLACADDRIAELNADFRGKPQPTNVLSWPAVERASEKEGGQPDLTFAPGEELGDIAIAYDTCMREAAETGRAMADHVTHLTVHGTLHLLGFDHMRDGDANLMEGIETEILGKLGISDPYTL